MKSVPLKSRIAATPGPQTTRAAIRGPAEPDRQDIGTEARASGSGRGPCRDKRRGGHAIRAPVPRAVTPRMEGEIRLSNRLSGYAERCPGRAARADACHCRREVGAGDGTDGGIERPVEGAGETDPAAWPASSRKLGGGTGIRTRARGFPRGRFSKPLPSAARPPLRPAAVPLGSGFLRGLRGLVNHGPQAWPAMRPGWLRQARGATASGCGKSASGHGPVTGFS